MSGMGWWLPHSLAGFSSCLRRPQLCSAKQRTDEEARREERRDKKKNAPNLIKSKGIAPKLCTCDLYGVGKISRKCHGSIWTQTLGISDHVQECSFSPQNKIGSILRARVDSIKFTHGVASTHVFARIKPTKSSPNALLKKKSSPNAYI